MAANLLNSTTHPSPATPFTSSTTLNYLVYSVLALLAFTIFDVIYQVKFSPLAKIPGPFLAKFSRVWLIWQKLNFRRCFVTHDLHKKYGPLVRIEPNQIAFLYEPAMREVYGKFNKSDFYVGIQFNKDDHCMTTLDTAAHGSKRKIFSSAYAQSNINQYEADAQEEARLFIERVKKDTQNGQKSVDIMHLMRFFSLDMLGMVALGQEFNIIKEKEDHFTAHLLDGILLTTGERTLLPKWLSVLVEKIPIPAWQKIVTSEPKMAEWAFSLFDGTKQQLKDAGGVDGIAKHTLLTRLLSGTDARTGKPMPDSQIVSELVGHLFAGTDTVSTTTAYLLWQLSSMPEVFNKLKEELKTIMPHAPHDVPTFSQLNNLPYLNAVVKEALRVYGAAPSALERVVPPGGMNLLGNQLPGGTVLCAQGWSMHRAARVFESPDEFKPERWLQETEEMRRHFMPFGAGPRVCVGQNLANIVVRLATATIVRNFDIAADPSTNKDSMKMLDTFLIGPVSGKVLMKFTPTA